MDARGLLFPHHPTGRAAAGLLIVRLVFGIGIMLHGWQKIQSDGGPTGWMNKPGQPPAPVPAFIQAAAAFSEFGGGIGIALGLLTPLSALAVAGVMATAILMVHRNDPFVGAPGQASMEPAAGYLAVASLMMLTGPGAWSLDRFLARRSPHSASHEVNS
jgi:putative oxidoreductase